MLRSVRELCGYRVHTVDGKCGRLRAFLFDDKDWAVRHLVIRTGKWLSGRRVLISPTGIERCDGLDRELHLGLTQEQVANCPDIEADPPVSEQWRVFCLEHYCPFYGQPGALWLTPGNETDFPNGNSHLRSTRALMGYHIQCRDGEAGSVGDFFVDDSQWILPYVLIQSGSWWMTLSVLLSADLVERVSWFTHSVYVRCDCGEFLAAASVERTQIPWAGRRRFNLDRRFGFGRD